MCLSWTKGNTSSDGHTHNNKTTLDKFGESNGIPTFNSSPIGSSVLSDFAGMMWNVLGDSITEKNSHATKHYYEYVKEWLGLGTINNYGSSGSTISSTHLPMSSRYSTMDATADIITVFGGVNDHGKNSPMGVFSDTTNTTFYGALHVLCQGLIKKYPSKRIGFITPHRTSHWDWTETNDIGIKLEDYVNAIKEVCAYYSIPVLDMFHEGNMYVVISEQSTLYTTDGLHLNTKGQELLARKIKNFLNKL